MKIRKHFILIYSILTIIYIVFSVISYLFYKDYGLLDIIMFYFLSFFIYFALKIIKFFLGNLCYFHIYGSLILSAIIFILFAWLSITNRHFDLAVLIPLSIMAGSLCNLLDLKYKKGEDNENSKK